MALLEVREPLGYSTGEGLTEEFIAQAHLQFALYFLCAAGDLIPSLCSDYLLPCLCHACVLTVDSPSETLNQNTPLPSISCFSNREVKCTCPYIYITNQSQTQWPSHAQLAQPHQAGPGVLRQPTVRADQLESPQLRSFPAVSYELV